MLYSAVFLDSNMSREKRNEVVADFNSQSGKIEVLITTYRIGSQGKIPCMKRTSSTVES